MSLDEFKRIFYMEYVHRMWGRATGMVFLLPAAFFWAKGWFSKPLKARVGVYAVLIGFQVGYPRVAMYQLRVLMNSLL